MRSIALLAAFSLVANACASPHASAADGPVPGGCTLPSSASLTLAETDSVLTPGRILQLSRPIAVYGPMGPKALPERCRVRWSVESGAADIDAAGRLTALANARSADTVVVVVRAMGAEARRRVAIVASGPMPLAGKWRQAATRDCVGSHGPVGELEFRHTGQVLLTFRPFESAVDWAGAYAYDAATGTITLTSSREPSDQPASLQAVARLSGGSLILTITSEGDRIGFFTHWPAVQTCHAVFQRL